MDSNEFIHLLKLSAMEMENYAREYGKRTKDCRIESEKKTFLYANSNCSMVQNNRLIKISDSFISCAMQVWEREGELVSIIENIELVVANTKKMRKWE